MPAHRAAPTPPFWQVHPTHADETRQVLAFLALLALGQWLAWLVPATPGANTIAHYLPLHVLMETVSIVIAMMVFAVGWNARSGGGSGNVVVLACAFFAVAWLDFAHTFSYLGMPAFFSPNEADKHLHFWLAARLIAALALLAVALRPWHLGLSARAKYLLFTALTALTALVSWMVIAHLERLPRLFVAGSGLTDLKKQLEYGCILINLLTAALLWRRMREPQAFKVPLLLAAVGAMAMSELYFTLYTTMTGTYNMLGHVYKLVSYLLIYRAVVVESIEEPYRALTSAQHQLELAVRASQTGLWDWNLQTGVVYFSPVWKAQLGHAPDEIADSFSSWEQLLHPDDREAAVQRAKAFAESPEQRSYESEFRMRHKDGRYHWILARGEKQFDLQGKALRLTGSHTDLTERKRAEDRFRSAVKASPTGMIMVDEHGLIVLTNERTDRLFGFATGELIGCSVDILVPPASREHHAHSLADYMKNPCERQLGDGRELFGWHREGRTFRIEVSLTPIEGSEARYVLASVVDLTARLQAEQRINELINFDALTGLPNRTLLNDRIDQAIAAAARERRQVAVLFLDIDHFKNVNDTLGHRIGDQLLVQVAERLLQTVRDTDTVARAGGDEFVVVLNEVGEEATARIASKLLTVVARPYLIETHELVVTPSIGIALYPDDGDSPETLYRRADTAMHRAKEDGRNDLRFFTPEMQSRAERVHLLESAMHHAVQREQFFLHYQPQLSVDGRRVLGVEALLRWKHPELGLISPAEFIPLAESNGLIVSIGAWVLRSAVQQLRHWMDAGMHPLVMAVNLSAVQFRQPDLPDVVSALLTELQLAPEYLELELTESVAMHHPQRAISIMDKLHSRGIRMSIDDFGTGYSSLSYLKKFNVYKVKIDQSFVRDIVTDTDDRAIVSAIIQMARSLGFETIAEGVETSAQHDFLRQEGCDEVQGYLFSRPLPADQVPAFILRTEQDAAEPATGTKKKGLSPAPS